MASVPAANKEIFRREVANFMDGAPGTALTPFQAEMAKLIEQKLSILIEKRKMRGTANIQRQGLMGVVNRLSEDKLERVKRMVEDDYLAKMLGARELEAVHAGTRDLVCSLIPIANTEQRLQLEDDLMDIANYCDIAIMLLRNSWDK